MTGEIESLSPTLPFEQFVQNVDRIIERSQKNIDEKEHTISLRNSVEALTAILQKILYIKEQNQPPSRINPQVNILDNIYKSLKKNLDPFIKDNIGHTKKCYHNLFRNPGYSIAEKDAKKALKDVKKIFVEFAKKYDTSDKKEVATWLENKYNDPIIQDKPIIFYCKVFVCVVAVAVAIYLVPRACCPPPPPKPPGHKVQSPYFQYIMDENFAKALEELNKLRGNIEFKDKDQMWDHFCKIRTGDINTNELEKFWKNYENQDNAMYKVIYQFFIYMTDPNPPEKIQKCLEQFRFYIPKNDDPKNLIEYIITCMNSHNKKTTEKD